MRHLCTRGQPIRIGRCVAVHCLRSYWRLEVRRHQPATRMKSRTMSSKASHDHGHTTCPVLIPAVVPLIRAVSVKAREVVQANFAATFVDGLFQSRTMHVLFFSDVAQHPRCAVLCAHQSSKTWGREKADRQTGDRCRGNRWLVNGGLGFKRALKPPSKLLVRRAHTTSGFGRSGGKSPLTAEFWPECEIVGHSIIHDSGRTKGT